MKFKITKLDNFGSGISYYNDKIFFIPKTIPNEEVEAEIIKETKKYYKGKLNKVIIPSNKRIESNCEFFNTCYGCHLRMMSYQDTLEYKVNKVKYLFKLDKLDIIPSLDNYRNKVVLRIKDEVLGYYEENSNNLIPITKCNNAKLAINHFINDYKKLGIKNGKLTIRCNYNNELLIHIESLDKISINNLTNHKIVGIILNNKIIHGQDHFIEIINNNLFKVSFNSFFQVNNEINSKLHNLLKENIKSDSVVLDLFCGVGSLSVPLARTSKKVYGVDNSEPNIQDALINKKMNKLDNLYFLLGDAGKTIKKINDKIDVVIVDPPRSGLNKEGINNLISLNPKQIVYISCDPVTLKRDLDLLNNYVIKKIVSLDMFPYTYHIESFVILERIKDGKKS